MRVLHVYKSYYPDTVGGIEQVISQLGRGLAALGHENRIFTLSPNPVPAVLRYPEGEVHRSRQTLEVASNNVSLSAFRDFRRQLEWADVVHYQFPWPFGDLLHVAVARRKPSVVSYQSDIVRQKWLLKAYRPLRDRFLLSVGAVVTTSPQYHASSEVLRNLPVPVKVVPNGVEESSYPQPRAEVLERWRARLGEGFFLFVGVLRYYKGLHTLVQAARGFAGQVVIAGDGPERSALERQVGAATGAGNVHLLGRVSDEDKMALLQLCRAFVFPSHLRSEAYGMSLVEAAMAGKPMVSCEIGTGTTFINENGTTGLAIPPADPAALRVAMQTLLDDPALARKLGAQARERFLAHFSASRMASAYEEIYAGLLAR
ncbi:glycosyltransferase [Ramlibacter henchirensis]|uniref:Glycosyltransferase n=1 Tax=Ramlibacter henchirensis TaxID=204072 RepID=A0A4Z0C4X2_9BURK|nr:glycosyltransferase [Ramlibacter henchirensis]TFZ05159.1 glycosyltransferase [Ramlibacter henchirensis]